MNDSSDQELLRDYAEHRSEGAFADLVRRHVDLVYSAALRMVCQASAAQDVTQAVFVALAQNAPQLTRHPVLSGWLHCTARNLAAKAVRSEVRRRACEQEAATMNELLAPEPNAPWEHIAPHLDAALGELNTADRDALLLRFFERKSAREMAQALGISDEAAQKRVGRAVERLREFFAKRGVAVGASSLAAVLSANAVQAAPVGAAATISTAVLAGPTLASTATVTATKAIAMTFTHKAIIGLTLALAAGAVLYEARQASNLSGQVNALQQQQANFAAQIDQLQRERDDSTNRLAMLVAENAQLKSSRDSAELLKLRGQVSGLKTALASAQQQGALAGTNSSSPGQTAIFVFGSNQVFHLDAGKLSAAGFKPSAPANLAYTDVSQLQNAGNATPEAAAQTVLWEVLQNGGRGLDQLTYHDPKAPESAKDSAARLLGHIGVEVSGASQVAFMPSHSLGEDRSMVRFSAFEPSGADASPKTTMGMLGFRRVNDGWYLEQFTPQSQTLMLKATPPASP